MTADGRLLDCVRYFHKAAGINRVAQIAKDIGARANPRTLLKEPAQAVRVFSPAGENTRECF